MTPERDARQIAEQQLVAAARFVQESREQLARAEAQLNKCKVHLLTMIVQATGQ